MAGAHAALQTELLKPAANGRPANRPPIWLAAFTLVLVIWLFGLYLPLFFGGFPGLIDSLDFSYYYGAAQIGLRHGWSHIYDLELQRQAFYQLHPAADVFDWRRYFVSPPPVAWVVAPLALMPIVPAFWTFAILSAAAFAVCGWVATPGSGLAKFALFLTAACIYPVLIAIQTGQVTPLIAAAVILAWWLVRRGMHVVAGIVLVLVVLKPQVALLVLPALAIAGERKLFGVWIVGAAALAAVSVVSLGSHGLEQLRSVLSLEQGQSGNLVWTLADLFGPGFVAIALQLTCAVLAFVAVWRHRKSLELVIVAGLLGSLLAAPYHNPSDFAMLAPAVWLYVRAGMPPWHWVWLAFGLIGTYLAASFGPMVLLVFILGWLALLVTTSPVKQSVAIAGRSDAAPAPE